jgi:CBS domain-containing protein
LYDGNRAVSRVSDRLPSDEVIGPDQRVADSVERELSDLSERRLGVLPVVVRGGDRLQGVVTEFDLLAARERILEEERHRERVLRMRVLSRRNLPRGDEPWPAG